MAETRESFTFISPVRLVFPNLTEAKQILLHGKPTGNKRFDTQLMFLYDHSQVADLQAAFGRVAMAHFGTIQGVTFPVKRGDAIADGENAKAARAEKSKDREYMRGHYLMSASSGDKYPPKLCLMEAGRIIDLTGEARQINSGKFYGGVEALVQVSLNAYKPIRDGDKPGVNCYLNMVCSLNKGASLGGASGAEVFSAYVGHVSDVDPSAGASVAAPF